MKSLRQKVKDRVWLRVAFDIAELGTCARRKVGCVFLDAKGRVMATGYNGTAPGEEHCITSPCGGAHCKSGEGLDLCEAIHAEQNALAQCKFPDDVHTVYCTDSPCIHCAKQLAVTSAQRVVFGREYPHSKSETYWSGLGRRWEHLPMQPSTFWTMKGSESVPVRFRTMFRGLFPWLIRK